MKLVVRSAVVYWLICLLVLIAVACVSRGPGTQINSFASIDHFLDGTPGLNDAASFASMAKDYYYQGHVNADNQRIVALWPPGFIFLEKIILKVFGINAPVPFILQLLACTALASMMLLQKQVLGSRLGPKGASILPFLILVFPVARSFLLEPIGVIYGETFSVSALISGCLLVILAARHRNMTFAFLAGAAFAISAYFRSQYELIILAMTGIAMPALIWCWIRLNRCTSPFERTEQSGNMRVIVVTLIAAHALMLPWRIHNYQLGFGPTWVQTSRIVVMNALSSEEYLRSAGGAFVVEGGGHLACKLEPSYCGKNTKALFYKAYLHHWLEWTGAKFSLIPKFWSPYFTWDIRNGSAFTIGETIADLVFLACLIGIIPLLMLTSRRREWVLMAWPVISFYGAFFIIFSLVQLETRYFYLVKLFAFFAFLNLAIIFMTADTKTEARTQN